MIEQSYTKYERARILGARALQLAMNAPVLLAITKEQLEDIQYDPLRIAELEFNANVLPITVKRPFPKKEEEEEEEGEELVEEEGEITIEKTEEVKKEEVVEEKEEKVAAKEEEEEAEEEPETTEVFEGD